MQKEKQIVNKRNNDMEKNYTLEKHLKTLASEDHDYDILASIWELNRSNLKEGLATIKSNYPHFSDHGIAHSNKIIDKIQCFLGEQRIKELGATDTFLLLMAGLTHDVGMILTYKMIEKVWSSEEAKNIVESLTQNEDEKISDAAKLILKGRESIRKENEDNLIWALEVKNAVTIITSEFFRGNHALLGSSYLSGQEEFSKMASGFHAEKLPRRYMDMLALVAYLHGASTNEVMDKLYQRADGWKGDYIHPRFIACMIRLGDLLDFDSDRFDLYSLSLLKDIPDSSVVHKEKHSSVRHMLVSPTSIEAELNCKTDAVYRVARKWFDWLEDEVSFQSREWSNIAPEDLSGLPPMISKGNIKILFNGLRVKPELMNLKFAMSQQKIFNILRGGGIYRDPGFVFIREIVQNAFDASNIQLCNDIRMGTHSYALHGKKIFDLQFPDDIPTEVYNQYPVNLTVQWKENQKNTIVVICEDKGTGISEEALLHMTQKVGESNRNRIDKDIPYWLKPTGTFGVGLQSIFFVADSFIVETKCIGEDSKRILFRSAEHGQYSTILENGTNIIRGTRVIVEIDRSRFKTLYDDQCRWEIRSQIDRILNDNDDRYISMIDAYVSSTFKSNGTNRLSYHSVNPGAEIEAVSMHFPEYKDCQEKYKMSCEVEKNILRFHFMEREVGSRISISFINEPVTIHRYPNVQFLVRGIAVKNADYSMPELSLASISWDLYSEESDKIVDISRDNITLQGFSTTKGLLFDKILPAIFTPIQKEFEERIGKNNGNENTSVDLQYLHYILTCIGLGYKYSETTCFHNIRLPKSYAQDGRKQVSLQRLLDATSVVFLFNPEADEKITGKVLKKTKEKIIITSYNLREIITQDKVLEKLVFMEDGQRLYFYTKKEDQIAPVVECNDIMKYHEMYAEHEVFYDDEMRGSVLAIKDYNDLAVVVKRSGKEKNDEVRIISPFTRLFDFSQYTSDIIGTTICDVQKYVMEHTESLLSEALIEYVKKNNVNKRITRERIVKCYQYFISNYLYVKNGGILTNQNTSDNDKEC